MFDRYELRDLKHLILKEIRTCEHFLTIKGLDSYEKQDVEEQLLKMRKLRVHIYKIENPTIKNSKEVTK